MKKQRPQSKKSNRRQSNTALPFYGLVLTYVLALEHDAHAHRVPFFNLQHFYHEIAALPKLQLVGLVTAILFFILLPAQTYYDTILVKAYDPLILPLPSPLPSPMPFPIRQNTKNSIEPAVQAKAVAVFDTQTNAFIWEREANTPLPPASLIKLLTAVVALEHCSPEKIVKTAITTPLKSDESHMGLAEGELISVENLLYGLLLPSGNDAAQTLAVHCTNNEKPFVLLMNEKADSIGMTQTTVTNATGQDEEGNISTAKDLTLLAQHALKNELIAKVVSTPFKQVKNSTGSATHNLVNTNVLLRQDSPYSRFVPNKTVTGVKTGTTDNAKQNFVVLFTLPKGQKIFVVVLGSDNRFLEVALVREWVVKHFAWKYPGPLPWELW